MPQESLLFDGTIRDNLQMVKPDARQRDDPRRAHCLRPRFHHGDAEGYNSSVGERGAGLSSGQRQRLALARAVLQNPRMLILDEAPALWMRVRSARCVSTCLKPSRPHGLFITHRLSTVRPADFIALMDRGAVMEVGSHKQLMAQKVGISPSMNPESGGADLMAFGFVPSRSR